MFHKCINDDETKYLEARIVSEKFCCNSYRLPYLSSLSSTFINFFTASFVIRHVNMLKLLELILYIKTEIKLFVPIEFYNKEKNDFIKYIFLGKI